MVAFTAAATGDEVVRAFAGEAVGKTGGVGSQTAIFLAAGKPKEIILAGRNRSKIQPVIQQIQQSHPTVEATFTQLDLADLSSTLVMAVRDYTTTKDGIETQFGANHVGHFLLTNLLMHKLIAAGGGARVVNVSSFGYLAGGVRFDDPNFQNGAAYDPWLAYAQSKTANILFTAALASKLKKRGILAFSLNPGLIFETKLMTNVSRDMFAQGHAATVRALHGDPIPFAAMNPKSLAAGSATPLYACLNPDLTYDSGAGHPSMIQRYLIAYGRNGAEQAFLLPSPEPILPACGNFEDFGEGSGSRSRKQPIYISASMTTAQDLARRWLLCDPILLAARCRKVRS
ncbi:MAG: hypothetical protein Q9191_005996 [Dirinaria sp. TL-2023a]